MLTIKRKKKVSKLLLAPVYHKEITGAMYRSGDFIQHASYKILRSQNSLLIGLVYKGEEELYFVASHSNVISHINEQGVVPLTQTRHLRFFKKKRLMNNYLSSITSK